MKKTIVLVLLALIAGASAYAYGGGGFFQGNYYNIPEYSNIGRDAEIVGGYGYGASRDGSRFGGFGMAIHDLYSGDLIGAFGGVISGQQVRTGPLTLSVNLWSGLGYVNPQIMGSPVGMGFLIEADAEAGFAVLPWLQLSVYAGMQAIGTLDPSSLISGARYAPVVGSRFTWGGF